MNGYEAKHPHILNVKVALNSHQTASPAPTAAFSVSEAPSVPPRHGALSPAERSWRARRAAASQKRNRARL